MRSATLFTRGGASRDGEDFSDLRLHGREGLPRKRHGPAVALQVVAIELDGEAGVASVPQDLLVHPSRSAGGVHQRELHLGTKARRAIAEARPPEQQGQGIEALRESGGEAAMVLGVEAVAVDGESHPRKGYAF